MIGYLADSGFSRLGRSPVLATVVAIALAVVRPVQAEDLAAGLAGVGQSKEVPGLIAASVGPEGVIESAAWGVRKRGTSEAVTTSDQFSLGSNSKSFTATLAATLVDEGVLQWSTTVAEVWPKQPVHAGFKEVTLEQLLAHVGGLQSDLEDRQAWSTFFTEKSQPQRERARMCFLVLTKPPQGTVGRYDYSNLGYVVAAAMLEERGGKPFEQLMAERVFKPLDMNRTEFYSAKKLKTAKDLLWGHRPKGEPIRPGEPASENPTVYAGCGTIRTTIDDWAKYIRWHFNESAGPVLKNDATLRKLHEGVAEMGPGQTYGFGWIHFQSPLGRTLQHAGSNTTQYCLVWVMPDRKRATLVVTNTGEKQAFEACDAATVQLMSSPKFR